MGKKIIKLRHDEDYITLGILLKIAKIIQTGGEAKLYLAENAVLVNGESENRRGRKLYRGDEIQISSDLFLIEKDDT